MKYEKMLTRAQARFAFYYQVYPSGCWEWIRSRSSGTGYGQFTFGNRNLGAHRVSYFFYTGKWPPLLDHVCNNRACVNPNHLRPLTHRDNILRGCSIPAMNARKTHCKRGHPLSGKNVRFDAKGRYCHQCKAERQRIAAPWRHKEKKV